jgi:antitoxin (DNA-binding transcriptional repressor) of toxin-antitoxin stability system
MHDLKVAEARARFGELLDEAEKGRPVSIERRGTRFLLIAEPAPASKRRARPPLFEFVDPDVAGGQWSWKAGRRGLAFTPRRKRR